MRLRYTMIRVRAVLEQSHIRMRWRLKSNPASKYLSVEQTTTSSRISGVVTVVRGSIVIVCAITIWPPASSTRNSADPGSG